MIFLLIILLSHCRTGDPEISYPDGTANEYSNRFIIEQHEGYSRLTVKDPWQGAEGSRFIYYITTDISNIPAGVERSGIILRPVEKIICTSTTHVAMLAALESTDLIEGVSGSGFIYNKKLRKRTDKGKVHDIGYESSYNTELIYSLQPDVVLVYGVGSESAPAFRRLSDMGIPVLYIADYLEDHPLARTEWIKVYGELLGKQDMAEEIFRSVSMEYNSILTRITDAEIERPSVMLGMPFKDKWFISPGNSYISKLIEDAGGRYLWAGTESAVSIPMSIEAVCQKGVAADIWLNPGSAGTIRDIHLVDPRLSSLPAASEGRVFNNNRRLNEYGGNDYWESGVVNPHLLLKDIARILNPNLFRDHELIYYTELKQSEDSR